MSWQICRSLTEMSFRCTLSLNNRQVLPASGVPLGYRSPKSEPRRLKSWAHVVEMGESRTRSRQFICVRQWSQLPIFRAISCWDVHLCSSFSVGVVVRIVVILVASRSQAATCCLRISSCLGTV
jgi:hypothetical protein